MIMLLPGVGAAATVVSRNADPSTAMLGGCGALLAGVAVTFAAIATSAFWAFLLGTAIAGVGFGTGFTGAYRIAVAPAADDDRASLIAAIFTVSYLAFSVPAVIAGVAATHYGLHDTSLVYCVAIAVLVAVAGVLIWRRRAAAKRA